MRYFKRTILYRLVCLLLLFVVLGSSNQVVFAVVNNRANVPSRLIKTLRDNSQTIDGANSSKYGKSGAYCDQTGARIYQQGQESWLSQTNNNNNQTISVTEGTDKIDLWYNALAYSCDRILGSNGKVAEQGLQETQINVVSSRASVSGVPAANLTVSNLNGDTDPINLNYNSAYFYNNRFVKRGLLPNNLPSEEPAVRPFSVSGLGGLKARDDPYEITVTARDFMVNRFGNGGTTYRCVYNDQSFPNVSNLSDKRCKQVDRPFTIFLKISPAYSGDCSITKINGIGVSNGDPLELRAGQQFDASFKVVNDGTKDWSMFFVKLGTINPLDNLRWGKNRLPIKEEAVLGGTFPVVRSGKSSSWSTTGNTFKAPDTEGDYSFGWRILQEGGTDNGYKNITNMGECEASVHVKVLKNRPYIMIEGSDVVSGAAFMNSGSPVCDIRTPASKSADIFTNGFHSTDVLGSLAGTSMAQYGTFASGNIGKEDTGANNTFRANYGFRRDPSTGLAYSAEDTSEDIRDGLFASINLPASADTFGHYYNDSSNPELPCVDVSAERSAAGASIISAADASSYVSTPGLQSTTVNGPVSFDSPITVPVGTHKTLIVNGDVTIKRDIKYSTSTPYTNSNIPYIKIIAKNILIDSTVNTIDANILALPSESSGTVSGGIVDTCSNMQWRNPDGSASPSTPGNWLTTKKMDTNSCRHKLLINGSMIARRILWKRTYGTLDFKANVEESECYLANYGGPQDTPADGIKITNMETGIQRGENCSAEVVKFSPESYLAGFEQGQGTLGVVPQSSQELPPIY